MPGLSGVILSNVLSLLRERFLGSHWQSPAQQTVPTPGLGGNFLCWAQKLKGKDASAGGPGAQGAPGFRARSIPASPHVAACGLPETVIQAFSHCYSQESSLLLGDSHRTTTPDTVQ